MTQFETEEKNERKKLEKNEINDRLIKDRTTRDIKTLFEQKEEKDYY